MEKILLSEEELFDKIKEIIDNSSSVDEDRNGELFSYFDSYKATEEIILLLKCENFLQWEN